MSDPLQAYHAEVRAAEDEYYDLHCPEGWAIGVSFWSANLDRLREMDTRHGVQPDDPRVYSIAAYQAERRRIDQEWSALCKHEKWYQRDLDEKAGQDKWAAQWCHEARITDCLARHFPGLNGLHPRTIDSIPKLWAYITEFLSGILERHHRLLCPAPAGTRPPTCDENVQQVYSLLHELQVPWAPEPPYLALTQQEARDRLKQIANRLERDEAERHFTPPLAPPMARAVEAAPSAAPAVPPVAVEDTPALGTAPAADQPAPKGQPRPPKVSSTRALLDFAMRIWEQVLREAGGADDGKCRRPGPSEFGPAVQQLERELHSLFHSALNEADRTGYPIQVVEARLRSLQERILALLLWPRDAPHLSDADRKSRAAGYPYCGGPVGDYLDEHTRRMMEARREVEPLALRLETPPDAQAHATAPREETPPPTGGQQKPRAATGEPKRETEGRRATQGQRRSDKAKARHNAAPSMPSAAKDTSTDPPKPEPTPVFLQGMSLEVLADIGRVARPAAPQTAPADRPAEPAPPSPSRQAEDRVPRAAARHSEDFRSVQWYGAAYQFTATQAACVKVLWRNWENGTPDIGEDTILTDEGVDAEARRLIDVFRDRKSASGYHPAWGTMIGSTRKGSYRLNSPEKS